MFNYLVPASMIAAFIKPILPIMNIAKKFDTRSELALDRIVTLAQSNDLSIAVGNDLKQKLVAPVYWNNGGNGLPYALVSGDASDYGLLRP